MTPKVQSKNTPSASEALHDKSAFGKLAFQSIKEHRGNYFVSYAPARAGDYFAGLSVVFLKRAELSEIAEIMQQECREWTQRYPVSLMVSAFDDADRLISLQAARACDHVIGILDNGKVEYHWKLLNNGDFPNGPLLEPQLREIYRDVSSTTGAERRQKAIQHAKTVRMGLFVIAMWGVAIPVTVALIGFAHPVLGVAIIAFSVGKAVLHALKTLGYIRRSKRDRQQEEDERRMRHHHYHCEQNPDGFSRLKIENFQREAREETHKEAEEIRKCQQRGAGGGE